MRRHSWNLWPSADNPNNYIVWAQGCRGTIVNLRINGVTGEVDRRLIRLPYKLWYKEMV